MATHLNSSHLVKAKIDRLKNRFVKEQERRSVLLKELRQIKKMEKSVMAQDDKQRIAGARRRIDSV